MEEAIGDNAWEKLHGPHAVPKKYENPFTASRLPAKEEATNYDHIYNMEIEANL
jgi:hypothetical protein